MKRVLLLAILPLALLSLPGSTPVHALAGDGYDLTWCRVAAGGGVSAASTYILTGTAGQPESGALLSGAGYTLVGGFWGGGSIQHRVYVPVMIK